MNYISIKKTGKHSLKRTLPGRTCHQRTSTRRATALQAEQGHARQKPGCPQRERRPEVAATQVNRKGISCWLHCCRNNMANTQRRWRSGWTIARVCKMECVGRSRAPGGGRSALRGVPAPHLTRRSATGRQCVIHEGHTPYGDDRGKDVENRGRLVGKTLQRHK